MATASERSPSMDRLDPWLEDGNIVLTVQGKHFRVHRSVLSSYSEVFKDMFDCTQPPAEGENSEDLIEQCPVVHLHDDATDVQIILKAMYNRSYPLPYYEKVPFSVAAAFLRLGEKYNIEQLTREGKARLRCAFEPSLSSATRMSSTHMLSLFPGITGNDPHNFLVMNLLQEMGLRAPLPLAMYQCAIACPLTSITDGQRFGDSVHSLSRPNLRAWILVKNILEIFRVRLAQCLQVSNNCTAQRSCLTHVRRLWSDEAAIGQPFGPWRHEWDKLFCDPCRGDLSSCRNLAIQRAWNQIPTAFGFDSWAEVSKSNDFPPFG